MAAARGFDEAASYYDEAASYYDEAYLLPGDVHSAVVALLRAHIAGRERCLDLGAGTGRFAVPLAESGVLVVALDVSLPMLRRLLEKRPEGLAVLPVAADAAALPFGSGRFDAALTSLLLQLVPDWPAIVEEVLRVLAPAGVLLVDPGGPTGLDAQLQARLAVEAGLGSLRPGLNDAADLDELMLAAGATTERLPPIAYSRTRSIDATIDLLDTNRYPVTWMMDDRTRRDALRRVRRWAASSIGDTGETRSFEAAIRWRRYELP